MRIIYYKQSIKVADYTCLFYIPGRATAVVKFPTTSRITDATRRNLKGNKLSTTTFMILTTRTLSRNLHYLFNSMLRRSIPLFSSEDNNPAQLQPILREIEHSLLRAWWVQRQTLAVFLIWKPVTGSVAPSIRGKCVPLPFPQISDRKQPAQFGRQTILRKYCKRSKPNMC